MEAIANIVVVPGPPQATRTEPVQWALTAFRDAHLEIMSVHARGTEVRGELDCILRTVQRVLETLSNEQGLRLETKIEVTHSAAALDRPSETGAIDVWVEPELLLELEDLLGPENRDDDGTEP